jgi:SHS2 domain-containing protein
MGSFELIEHTADLGVVGRGDTLAEALEWVAIGMLGFMADLDQVRERETVSLSIAASDREALAVDWLNELLYRFEADGFLPKRLEVTVNDDGTALDATCVGEVVTAGSMDVRAAVKAATYHSVEVVQDGGGWRVRVYLDI